MRDSIEWDPNFPWLNPMAKDPMAYPYLTFSCQCEVRCSLLSIPCDSIGMQNWGKKSLPQISCYIVIRSICTLYYYIKYT